MLAGDVSYLSSGTATCEWLGSMVQNGKFSAGACNTVNPNARCGQNGFSQRAPTCMSHMRLNSEDLPTFGKPTIPIFKLLFTRPKRLADFCTGEAAALGGISLLRTWLQERSRLFGRCARARRVVPHCDFVPVTDHTISSQGGGVRIVRAVAGKL